MLVSPSKLTITRNVLIHKAAQRAADQTVAATENVIQNAQLRYGAAVENANELNAKLVHMVRANAEAALEAGARIATATLTFQAKELRTTVWQNFLIQPR